MVLIYKRKPKDIFTKEHVLNFKMCSVAYKLCSSCKIRKSSLNLPEEFLATYFCSKIM